MKRVLIISPHFPPINAPDMQRVRMSLPYYREMGWEAEVITVDEKFIEGFRDELLNETIPADITVHRIKAWSATFTRKLGLSSLSIRSYFQFKQKGSQLLKSKKFDLVFFSTTMFHVCALGRYWKEKFGVPFIIDLQDPWRNDFYLDKPKSERPPKFWLAYNIHKYMEAYAMPSANGVMAVSQGYIDSVRNRYPILKNIPSAVIPFGCSVHDFELVKNKKLLPEIITGNGNSINVVYIGAVTKYFLPIMKAFFIAFNNTIKQRDHYHFYFIGTNYTSGINYKPVEELAAEMNMQHLVTEVPDRIPYFSAIATMLQADILFIPGSMDVDYNASKVYNNILTLKPIFSIFNNRSLVKDVIERSKAGIVVGVQGNETVQQLSELIAAKMPFFESLHEKPVSLDMNMFDQFTAKSKTQEQVKLFNEVIFKITEKSIQ